MTGFLVDIFQVITLSGRPGEWTKQEKGQRVTHCSCALLPWLIWLRPLYFELYCQAVCTWKLWHLPLSWFDYKRMRLNLINPNVLKVNTVCMWRFWVCPIYGSTLKERLVYEVILLNKILMNHLLSKNMQWNYASFTWHLWRSTTENKNFVKLLTICQTIDISLCASRKIIFWLHYNETFNVK